MIRIIIKGTEKEKEYFLSRKKKRSILWYFETQILNLSTYMELFLLFLVFNKF